MPPCPLSPVMLYILAVLVVQHSVTASGALPNSAVAEQCHSDRQWYHWCTKFVQCLCHKLTAL
jgi:hypothetical protein